MTNEEIIQSIQAVKERLFTKGWRKLDAGPEKGPNCIMGAIGWHTGGSNTETCQLVSDAISGGKEYGLRGKVITFNDAEETTFDDIIDFLDFRIKELENVKCT